MLKINADLFLKSHFNLLAIKNQKNYKKRVSISIFDSFQYKDSNLLTRHFYQINNFQFYKFMVKT